MNLTEKLNSLKNTALVSYVMVGDPDLNTSYKIIDNLIKSGSDIIELGVPFSDPSADGKIIQAAAQNALKNNISLDDCLNLAKKINQNHPNIPVILMGYFNPIYNYGVKKFIQNACCAKVSGFIIVDLPYEELANYPDLASSNIPVINLITPLTTAIRLGKILKDAAGFLYYISVFGITGTKEPNLEKTNKTALKLKSLTNKKIGLGFGIKSKKQIEQISGNFDLVIIGSAYCKIIQQHKNNKTKMYAELRKFNSSLR